MTPTRQTGRTPFQATGYKMIETVEIKRFRGFESARLTGCARINLIVGENGAGKTALLESIFLASGGSPEIALRLRNWRGLGEGQVLGAPEQVEDALWRDIFFNLRKELDVLIALKGTGPHTRSVRVSWNDQGSTVTLAKGSERPEPFSGKAPVSFKWKDAQGAEHSARPSIEGGQLKLPVAPRRQFETSFFPANHLYSPIETVQRYSTLSRRSEEEEAVDLFRQHFPGIDSLSIEVVAGSAMLYAKVGTLLPERMPISLMGAGMSKLAAILFAIPTQKQGVILIDELENGIYYRRLPKVWEALHAFATRFDAQLFVSTHSAECLSAAATLAEKYPDDFSVVHVSNKEGKTILDQYGGDRFVEAMQADLEIR